MAKKKKATASNSRGFATTSVPSKVPVRPPDATPEPGANVATQHASSIDDHPATTISGHDDGKVHDPFLESSTVYETALRSSTKFWTDVDVERRSRKSCISLTLPDDIVQRALTLERTTRDVKDESVTTILRQDMLLERAGLSKELTRTMLETSPSVGDAEELLFELARLHGGNLLYEDQPVVKQLQSHTPEELTPPSSPKLRPSRMTELLSDESDQDDIMEAPTRYYIDNQLELLALRARAKKDRDLQTKVTRQEKRVRVIEQQHGFDKKTATQEVRRQLQGGYLERAAEEWKSTSKVARPEPVIAAETATPSSGVSDIDEEGWLTIHKSLSDLSEANQQGLDQIETKAAAENPAGDESGDSLEIGALFEKSLEEPEVVETLPFFPLTLRGGTGISPVKLLQTHLKRADKVARDEFDGACSTLILRFTSSKISRRKVVLKSDAWRFADMETARNYLSMKALFDVPELQGDKAGVRFAGVYKQAWNMLQEQERLAQQVQMRDRVNSAEALRNVRLRREAAAPSYQSITVPNDAPRQARQAREDYDSAFALWQQYSGSPAYDRMAAYRATLPIAAFRAPILDSVRNNQVTILCGETGCGKSTQLPTFILEEFLSLGLPCKIYVTEPRRISAVSLANRVSAELGEPRRALAAGESLLGFSIRLDSQVSETSRLIYATTGIVLRMLEESPELGELTHLIIDEVHERSIESDFLLIVVRRLLQTRRDLRVVLMSATLQAEKFNDYFGGHCCIFQVPGRTFPVEQRFLEHAVEETGFALEEVAPMTESSWDVEELSEEFSERTRNAVMRMDPYKIHFDLIICLLEHIAKDVAQSQAILVFLPGLGEIRRLLDLLTANRTFGDCRRWVLYALHSTVSSEKQQAAFDVPPRGTRKIVLATNIAETGITIPDITCVVDAGKHKESRFDARRQLSRLVETYVAKANARQRMGRAGRVQPGICYHLFTRARFDKMAEHQLPEFQRLNLDELALRVKTVGLGKIDEVLSEALDPPTADNIRRSIDSLVGVGALDLRHELTLLGRYLARLPVDVILGKLIVYGLCFSCLDPCLVIAASLSSKSPFETSLEREREVQQARTYFERGQSDFLTIWTAYRKWRIVCQENPRHEAKFCRDNCLSMKNLGAIEELRLQYIKVLVESGLLSVDRPIQRLRFVSSRDGFVSLPKHCQTNESQQAYIELCLCAAFYPNLVNVDDGFRTVAKNQPIVIHPSSVNCRRANYPRRWLYFYALLKTKTATLAHETGPADDIVVALTCGDFEVRPFSGIVSLDHGRVKFAVPDLRTLVAISLLREHLEATFALFLEGIRRPSAAEDCLLLLRDLVTTCEQL